MSDIAPEDLTHVIRSALAGRSRLLVAIVGAPGSGKSTLARELADDLGPIAQVIPMDGFHRDNDWLNARGLYARKGAPETFDAAGFAALISAIKAGEATHYPTFDRAADATIPKGGQIDPEAKILLVEGNYLLLDHPDWAPLHALWDMSVLLDVPMNVLRTRLIARWIEHGLREDAAIARAEGNDIPNAHLVASGSIAASHRVSYVP